MEDGSLRVCRAGRTEGCYGNRRDGEQHTGRANGIEGVGGFLKAMAKQQNKTKQQIEKEFFAQARPTSLLKRFATPDEVAAMVTILPASPPQLPMARALRVDGGVMRAIL